MEQVRARSTGTHEMEPSGLTKQSSELLTHVRRHVPHIEQYPQVDAFTVREENKGREDLRWKGSTGNSDLAPKQKLSPNANTGKQVQETISRLNNVNLTNYYHFPLATHLIAL